MIDVYPAINPADYRLPDQPEGLDEAGQLAFDEHINALLQEPLVRLCNIYVIREPDGTEIDFIPNPPQCAVLHALFCQEVKRVAIPKARAIGFSTLIELVMFDRACFNDGVEGAIIDQTQPDAQAKLGKIKFAYEKLPPLLKDALIADNKGVMVWANGSSISAGLNARGRTPQMVHISEWGPIAYKDPERSKEIITGVIQSASGRKAVIIAESTHMGGKAGDWYDLIKRSNETKPEHRTDEDFRVMFFPWWQAERYTMEGEASQIDEATRKYFDGDPEKKLVGIEERTGHCFTPGQRLFYFKKKQILKRNIYAEFPSVLEECWLAPHEGAIYGDVMEQARSEGRITTFSRDTAVPVFTFWDIGWNDSTTVWFLQLVGRTVLWLHFLKHRHQTAAQMMTRVRETGIPVACYYLPHDAVNTAAATGTNYRTQLELAGARNIKVVPRSVVIWDGINALRDIIGRSEFHAKNCEQGIADLEAYHTAEAGASGIIKREPVHDESSHAADAARYAGEAFIAGMVNTAQAAKFVRASEPLYPDGQPVVIAHAASKFRARRARRANSDYSPL